MEILETKERKMNKIKREEREDLHTFSDTTQNVQQTHSKAHSLRNISEHIARLIYYLKCISTDTPQV